MPKTNTAKTVKVTVVPFFARFLEKQAPVQPQYPQTLKYPSDWEEY